MASYCTTSDVIALTDTSLDTTTLQAIIDDGDVEINAYLKARGVTGSACAETKSASMKLANAGLILRNPMGAEGNQTPMAINILRKAAFQTLDDYLATQTSLNTPRRAYMVKVN
jgi:hypothetical protein